MVVRAVAQLPDKVIAPALNSPSGKPSTRHLVACTNLDRIFDAHDVHTRGALIHRAIAKSSTAIRSPARNFTLLPTCTCVSVTGADFNGVIQTDNIDRDH